MTDQPIKILVVDDHVLVRKGLIALLDGKPGVEVIGEGSDGDDAVRLALELEPDVILLDLIMPNKDGITALKEIREANPDANVIILTSFSKDASIRAALDAGAKGYQLKDATPAELLLVIRMVHQGQYMFHPEVNRRLVKGFGRPETGGEKQEDLTERELEILNRVAQGCTNREIALALSISARTVSTHVSNILGKLGLENRTQATRYAIKAGLVLENGDQAAG
jgi:NarL family two-component system response regulator LiaR